MRSSSALRAAGNWPLWLAAAVVTVALGGASGCAHAPRRAAEPVPAEPDHEAPAPPTRRANLPPMPPEGTAPPGRPDPSEEITAEELATLPDPVPGNAPAPGGAPEGVSRTRTPDPGFPPLGGDSAPPAPSQGLWRVQIYASESRAEAERVGRAAARRLGTALQIGREGGLYKVRLGGYATEQEAQALRDRAVGAGYPGAFRTRAAP